MPHPSRHLVRSREPWKAKGGRCCDDLFSEEGGRNIESGETCAGTRQVVAGALQNEQTRNRGDGRHDSRRGRARSRPARRRAGPAARRPAPPPATTPPAGTTPPGPGTATPPATAPAVPEPTPPVETLPVVNQPVQQAPPPPAPIDIPLDANYPNGVQDPVAPFANSRPRRQRPRRRLPLGPARPARPARPRPAGPRLRPPQDREPSARCGGTGSRRSTSVVRLSLRSYPSSGGAKDGFDSSARRRMFPVDPAASRTPAPSTLPASLSSIGTP